MRTRVFLRLQFLSVTGMRVEFMIGSGIEQRADFIFQTRLHPSRCVVIWTGYKLLIQYEHSVFLYRQDTMRLVITNVTMLPLPR